MSFLRQPTATLLTFLQSAKFLLHCHTSVIICHQFGKLEFHSDSVSREFVSDVVISLNGSEVVKVGSYLFIDYMSAAVARGIHIDVSEVCADILRRSGNLERDV